MKTIFKIEGMSCNHCVRAVREAVEGVSGVEAVEVDLAAGQATVTGEAPVAELVAAIEEAGYTASPR